jgi:hypothetical protein
MARTTSQRTIYTTYRNHTRLARIRLRRPATWPPLNGRITALLTAIHAPDEPAQYTPELALELITATSELPASKRALHLILAEHRRALHTIATQAIGQPQTPTTG